jgi:malate synthase
MAAKKKAAKKAAKSASKSARRLAKKWAKRAVKKVAKKAAKPTAKRVVAKAPARKAVAKRAAPKPAAPKPVAKPVAAAKPAVAPKPAPPTPAKPAPAKPVAAKPAPKPAVKPAPAKPATPMLAVPPGVKVTGAVKPGYEQVLTHDALAFVAELERSFGARRRELLAARAARQARLDAGEKPDFLAETAGVRAADWTVAPLPRDILDRRVEITGPVDRKMVINALNSGASVFMADFEDATTPTWANLIEGQANLRDAVRGTITFTDPVSDRFYKLNDKHAVLFVRPRGWHLPEKHVLVDGAPMSGSLFDFGLYVFHNAKAALAKGSGPYFYLPKMESHLEARLWNDVFVHAQDKLGVRRGSIKATVLIETILATFEVDEILYELREHSAGLNCGRWDYIFSFIKKFANDPAALLPDRAQVTMTAHFMRSYSQLVIKTCHRRNVHAMGGMAAQIPIKDDPAANEAAMAKVRADKEREAGDGHDGTWVAHPGLVPIAKAVFDQHMPEANQIARKRQDVNVTAADLLQVPAGTITEAGLRTNINVGIGYLEAWLRGLGCVPLYNLMEDAATAEISRAQVWQWIAHKAKLDDGRPVDAMLCRGLITEELEKTKALVGAKRFNNGRYAEAAEMFGELIEAPIFPEFLTLPAYDWIVAHEE